MRERVWIDIETDVCRYIISEMMTKSVEEVTPRRYLIQYIS